MHRLFDLILLMAGAITFAYSARQLSIAFRIGGFPRREGKGPLRREDYPALYWGVVVCWSFGLLVMVGGGIVLLLRLAR